MQKKTIFKGLMEFFWKAPLSLVQNFLRMHKALSDKIIDEWLKKLKVEKIGLNRASPQPERAGIGLDFFIPIGLAKIRAQPDSGWMFLGRARMPTPDFLYVQP